MNKPIQKGDLVMVVKSCPHCGDTSDLGTVFLVKWMGYADGYFDCCGKGGDAELCADERTNGNNCWPVSILKRIDPPAIDESEQTEKELAL